MDRDLEGKTALVTGAGRGMGRGIAERLAEAGALVALLDAQPVEAAITAIEGKGGRAFHVPAEIGPPGGIETLLATLDAELAARGGDSQLDILVNNIGGGIYEPFDNTGIETLDWTLNLNIRVPFLITTALAPRIRDGGRIVNISSAGSRIVDPEILAARQQTSGDPVEALSARQREIMSLAAAGRDANAIAAELHLAPGSVRQELSKAYAVLVPEPTPGTDLRTSAVLAYLRATHPHRTGA